MQIKNKNKVLRSDIQQIRAISVIAVVLFHSFPEKFAYGYLGVDVFFFLSGFLIFPQIYDITNSVSKSARRLNVKKFILRRIYRIAPALGFCISVIWVLFFFFGPSPKKLSGPEFYISILSIFGMGNLAALNYSADYFNSVSPLTHFWSLGVEMQSYLLFAALVFFSARIFNKSIKRFRIFLFLIIVASLLSKYIFVYYSNIFKFFGLDTLAITGIYSNFYLTPNRIWQFALGGLFASFAAKSTKYIKLNQQISVPLLIIVVVLLFSTISIIDNFRVIIVLVSIGIYLISDIEKNLTYISPVLVWIGDRSYSVYLYHLPILYVLHGDSTPLRSKQVLFVLAVLIILFMSNFSYRYIEVTHKVPKSFVDKRAKVYSNHKKLIFTSYLIPVLIIILTVLANNIFSKYNNFPINFRDNYAASNLSKCPLGQINEPCLLNYDISSKNWLLLGDSHAGSIQGVLAEVASQSQTNLTVWNKCRFFDPKLSLKLNSLFPKWCVDSNSKRIEYIKRTKPSLIFITYQNGSVARGDKKMTQNLWQDIFAKTLISVNNSHSKVVLFSQIPQYKNSPMSDYRYGFLSDKELNINQFPDLKKQRKFENKLINHEVLIIDLVPIFCNSTSCTRFINNWLYLDSNHLSSFGAQLINPTIRKYLYENHLR